MGLHGRGAKPKSTVKSLQLKTRKRAEPWKKPGLSRVERVIAFLEFLPITKGIYIGKKLKLLPGQRRFVEAIYDRLDSDGRRKIKIAIKSEPRGNGKTGLLAGLALCHLLGPEAEPRGEIYSASYTKLQSALMFAEMKATIEAIPQFDARVNIQRYGKIIEVMDGDGVGSIFESLSADDKRAHGLSPTLWVFDEFAQATNTELLDNLKTAMGKRKESLGVIISTQAANDLHPLSQLIDDAAVGEDENIYVQVASAPSDANIFDETTWFDCNEALGKFLDLKEFRSQAEQARRQASFRARFKNLRLNQRVDASVQFISDPEWMECAGKVVPDPGPVSVGPCYAGLDLSQTKDMTSLCLYWPNTGAVKPYFWLPDEGLLERGRREHGHYRVWRDAGLLETTPGAAINHKAVILRLAEIAAEHDLKAVAYDRAFIKTFQAQCEEQGVKLPLVEFGQGYVSMSPAVQLLEAAVADKKIHHGGHPILRWQVSNAALEIDPAGNRKITKKRSTGHVDGVIALLMAMGQAAKTPPPRKSVYETRGIIGIHT